MSSKPKLTGESLIDLLEKHRLSFTGQYRPLRTSEEIALRKANDLVTEPFESLTRNYPRKKAITILIDIKNCISYDVFVLCALATNVSTLGASKLGDHVSLIENWWEGVHHPESLAIVSRRYGTKESKQPEIKKPMVDILSASRTTTAQHGIAQRTESLRPEPSAVVQSPTLWRQQQDSIISTARPFQFYGSQSGPDNENQFGLPLTNDQRNPALQTQPNIMSHYQVADERSAKRPRLSPQHIPGLELPGESQYNYFSFMRRHMIENVPEPFRTGMKTSNLWGEEMKRGGLAITNGLSMYLPESPNNDSFLVLRLGYYQGFNIFNMFGLGDPDTQESRDTQESGEYTAEDARA